MNEPHAMMGETMAAAQGATPPAWLNRDRWSLVKDAVGGIRQNVDKVVQLVGLLLAMVRPSLVRRRLQRLRALGHIDVLASVSQLLVAARDQMMVSATEETRLFYRSQGIPWIFHNLRRFVSGPATMLDPVGLFSPRDTIIHHVLQTFHRHPIYDLVLLRAHERGLEEMLRQAQAVSEGTHPHQRALASLIEDGSYHQRLPRDVAAFIADPAAPARPIPEGLLPDAYMMTAMDQFKDIGGYLRYASRLTVGPWDAVRAWAQVAFDETIGGALGVKLGPTRVCLDACEPEIVARHLPR